MKNLVITIGREFGSAGKDIGLEVAKRLGVRCYDKELLTQASENSEFCQEIFEKNDEKPTNSFLYSLFMDTHSLGGYSTAGFADVPLNQKVFLAQFETIKQIAEKESCVIVGRCADYALQDNENVISVFIRADDAFRIEHLMETYNMDDKAAKELMDKIDKKRQNYYNYYTSKRWGDSRSYDLCLNASDLGIDGCADMILQYAEIKKKFLTSNIKHSVHKDPTSKYNNMDEKAARKIR